MKNDSWGYPIETPLDDMFDHNKDGELTGLETMQRDAMLYNSYKQTTSDDDDEYGTYTGISSGYTPKSSDNSKLQGGYNILFVLAIGFIAIAYPIMVIIGFIKDADYFIEQPEFQFGIFVTIVDIIVLLVYICKKINRSCEPDLSQCTTNEERGLILEKAEKEKQKEFIKLILVIISICVAIGLIAFLKVDISYREAVDEVINPDKIVRSFDFDTENHPNYKDAQGWELYVKSKSYYVDTYDEDFLNYEFKYTNSEQDKAILELKNKIIEDANDRENVLEQESDDSYTTTTKHYYTTTTKHYTTKYYTTKHTTAKYDDPYDVNDYSNEEDFYYDNYDDFESYEDAEDYYNEYHDE